MRHSMITWTGLVATIALAVCSMAATGLGQEDNEDLAALRAEFIAQFDWIQLNSTPGDAKLLEILVSTSGAKRGVEVGTATGYGAIHMGIAFERNGGHLTTIDISPKMVAAARENLKKVKLDDTVTVVEGDALEVLPKLEGTYDFVYIDAVKRDYLKYFRALEPKLEPGAVIVADNVIRSAGAMQDFLTAIAEDPNYLSQQIRASDMKDDGQLIIYKLGPQGDK